MSLNTHFTPALAAALQANFLDFRMSELCAVQPCAATHKQLKKNAFRFVALSYYCSWIILEHRNYLCCLRGITRGGGGNICLTTNKKLVIETSGENYKADFFICSEKWNWVTQGRGISIFLSFSPRLYHPCRKQFVGERNRNVQTGKLGERNREPE